MLSGKFLMLRSARRARLEARAVVMDTRIRYKSVINGFVRKNTVRDCDHSKGVS
jgi:hypothetical protein